VSSATAAVVSGADFQTGAISTAVGTGVSVLSGGLFRPSNSGSLERDYRNGEISEEEYKIRKENLNQIKNHPATKAVKVLSTELTPIGDVTRIGVGKDPYTGNNLSPERRGAEASQVIFTNTIGKFLKIFKGFGALDNKTIDTIDTNIKRFDKANDGKNGIQKEFNQTDNGNVNE